MTEESNSIIHPLNQIKKNLDEEDTKSNVFLIIQQLLQFTPLLIWGSGATVDCGLPTMKELGLYVKNTLSLSINENANFEEELCKNEFEPFLEEIRSCIWECVNKSDIEARTKLVNGNDEYFNAIALLLKKFCQNHPKDIKIITTNYDRVLENVSAWNDFIYTDGSGLGDLMSFSMNKFRDSKYNVKIVKVHGSLSWGRFMNGALPRVVNSHVEGIENVIIIPGNNKYREAHFSPYRELIQISDEYVKEAKAFLVVGFGFNDMHITPKVTEKIKNGTPVVVVTKVLSENTNKLIAKAKKYVVLSNYDENSEMTRIDFKINDSSESKTVLLQGKLWSLSGFIEVLV